MIKTFIVGAEYDKSELIDVVLRQNDPLIIRLKTSPVATLEHTLIEIQHSKSREYISRYMDNPEYIEIPHSMQIPGIIRVVVSEIDEDSIVKTYTVPPIEIHDTGNRFSGHDVIAKILAALPRIEQLERDVAELKSLKGVVDGIINIVYDPLS